MDTDKQIRLAVFNMVWLLCKIHHAAFKQHIIGVSPDYQIKLSRWLKEKGQRQKLLQNRQELIKKLTAEYVAYTLEFFRLI